MSRKEQSTEERVEEVKTVKHFMKLVRSKFEGGKTLEGMIYGRREDYQAEMNLLSEVNNLGWNEGRIAAVVCFLFLRRHSLMRLIKGSYKLDPPPNKSPFSSRQNDNSALFKVTKLIMDASLCVLAAFGTSLYFTDHYLVMATVANVPLVPGRSAISDEFCPDICQEYHSLHSPEYWKHVESPILKNLSTFCRNCERRAAYEQKLRSENGLPPGAPVSIPPPGVPTDYMLKEGAYTTQDDDNGSFEYSDSFGEEEMVVEDGVDWADSFVIDQEEDDDANSSSTDSRN